MKLLLDEWMISEAKTLRPSSNRVRLHTSEDVLNAFGEKHFVLMELRTKRPCSKQRPKKEDQTEITRLRQELKRVKEENEILKKAAAFFAKELDWNTNLFVNIAKNTKWCGYVRSWRCRPVAFMAGWIGRKANAVERIAGSRSESGIIISNHGRSMAHPRSIRTCVQMVRRAAFTVSPV